MIGLDPSAALALRQTGLEESTGRPLLIQALQQRSGLESIASPAGPLPVYPVHEVALFPSAQADSLETHFRVSGGNRVRVAVRHWNLPVPGALQEGDRDRRFDDLFSQVELLGPETEGMISFSGLAGSRAADITALLEILSETAPGTALHYQSFPRGGGALSQSQPLEMRLDAVRIYRPQGEKSGAARMDLLYVADIPFSEPADYTFSAVVTTVSQVPAAIRRAPARGEGRVPPLFRSKTTALSQAGAPDPGSVDLSGSRPERESRRYRIDQTGWFRVSDGTELGEHRANGGVPIELKQAVLRDGRFIQAALYSERENRGRSWSGTGLGTRLQTASLERLVRQVTDSRETGRRSWWGLNSSRRAGAFYETGDLLNLDELQGLLPVNGHDAPVDWLFRSRASEGEDDSVWIGLRRNPDRATFVLESGPDPEELIRWGNQVVDWLAEAGFPDYNAWIVAREDGGLRLAIRPRSPERNDLHGRPVPTETLYLIRLPSGGHRFLSEPEIERFGLSHLQQAAIPGNRKLERVVLEPAGVKSPSDVAPVFSNAVDVVALLGLIHYQSAAEYKDPYLLPRLEEGLDEVGARVDEVQSVIEKIREMSEDNTLGKAREEATEQVSRALDAVQTGSDLIALVKRIQAAGLRYEETFQRLTPAARDAWTRQFFEKAAALAAGDTSIHLEFVPETEGSNEAAGTNGAAGKVGVVGVGTPTLDLIAEIAGGDGEPEALHLRAKAGGSAAHAIQTLISLGFPARLVAAAAGKTGEAVAQALGTLPTTVVNGRSPGAAAGVPAENGAAAAASAVEVAANPFEDGAEWDSATVVLQQPVGTPSAAADSERETRVSVMVARQPGRNRRELRLVGAGSQRPVSPPEIARLWSGIPSSFGSGSYGLIWGERLPGSELEQIPAMTTAARWIRATQAAGHPVFLSVNDAWPVSVGRAALNTAPAGVFLSAAALARQTDSDAYRLSVDPDAAAEAAYHLRQRHGVRDWALVYLPTGALVLVTARGWWHVAPAPLHQLTYTSGAADTAFGVFVGGVLNGEPPLEALQTAVTASAVFMGRDPGERGLPTLPGSNGQADGAITTPAQWPVRVRELLVPKVIQDRESEQRQARLDAADAEAFPPAPQSEFPALTAEQEEHSGWITLWESVEPAAKTQTYRFGVHPALLGAEGAERLREIGRVAAEFQQAGVDVRVVPLSELGDPGADDGVRRLTLLPPDQVYEFPLEPGRPALAVAWNRTPLESRLWSRVVGVGLAVASFSEGMIGVADDDNRLITLKNYYAQLGVPATVGQIRTLISGSEAERRLMLQRLQISLTAAPLQVYIQDYSFNEFLEFLARDLSA
ncbi:MAG: hypothetical protein COV76_02985 [Candidatus Omnitrophica bacterium CG11_big_fil_rev_8_21_14_0_20_64_10]|nr:MAG: hypothetical protein COV76_02985 [Candidatus Omnitrophica bacterium CG11_big_fil_rev_8_21_14_0_20_64_10]